MRRGSVLLGLLVVLLVVGSAYGDGGISSPGNGYNHWEEHQEQDVAASTPVPAPTATPVPLDTTYPNYVNPWLSLDTPSNSGYCPLVGGAGWLLPLLWPVDGQVHDGRSFRYGHRAIDIDAPVGSIVRASATGTTIFAGQNINGYGNLVVLAHGSGWQTFYAHLSQVHVSCGSVVSRGETIGLTGLTGGTTFPHLHVEVRNGALTYHPLMFLEQ